MTIFEKRESQVRSYCRNFPSVFAKARGAEQYNKAGERYIDFFAGAGALNYGHNNPYIKEKVMDYLAEDNVIHALDFFTEAKEEFLKTFDEKILTPKGMDYKVMFCGPTGANSVESAMKLARKNTGRMNIMAFHGAFHGMSEGALSVTGASNCRENIAHALTHTTFMPYGFDEKFDTLGYLRDVLSDPSSGIEKPAAIILETVQAEGGVCPAPIEWLQGLRAICDEFGIIMIIDDIQVGCGRAGGGFFSFEQAGIQPDMVTLSKSISGFGVPMALLLVKPELDTYHPGEHNGTYRGFQLSFVGAKAGIEYFCEHDIPAQVKKKHEMIADYVANEILPLDPSFSARGRGIIYGINVQDGDFAKCIGDQCFQNNLILERAGRNDEILKIMPPLVIEEDVLLEGLGILKKSIQEVMQR
ncbi:diaminobutyrate--2-oxoglutarate transaminase [Eubacterium aggregans]|uniref:diaminobutyrate--2-oxoglutarate transaminase n=1 Tax=Eubacterium aggregans TaxID=81409 RepID=UPI003F3BAE09